MKRTGGSGTGGIGERSVNGDEVGFGQEVVHALVRGPILLLLRQRGALVIDHLAYDQRERTPRQCSILVVY